MHWKIFNMFIIINGFGYEDLKNEVTLLIFWIFPRCWENSEFWLFFTYFSVKFSQNFSTYSNQEYLQVKKYRLSDRCLKKFSKKLLNLLRVLRGKLTLGPSCVTKLEINFNKIEFIQFFHTLKKKLKNMYPSRPTLTIQVSAWVVYV